MASNKVFSEAEVYRALVNVGAISKRDIERGVVGLDEIAIEVDDLSPEDIKVLKRVGGKREMDFIVFPQFEQE